MWNTPMYDTTKLTLELRDIVENGVKIWDFDYPSYYSGDDKTAFEKKVIEHYYFRQIGQETTGRFLHLFRSRIREIMPRYIELYKTVEIMANIDDPFGNVDVTETSTETRKGTVSTTGSSTETNSGASETNTESEVKLNGKNVTSGSDSYTDYIEKDRKSSDTPQGSVVNITQHMSNYESSYESITHDSTKSETNTQTDTTTATGKVTDTNSNTATSSGESATSNDETITHTTTKKGNQGVNTYAHDMIEFRQSIIDVDLMIIADLNCLFLGVY